MTAPRIVFADCETVYEAHTALGDVRMGRDIFDRVMAGGAP